MNIEAPSDAPSDGYSTASTWPTKRDGGNEADWPLGSIIELGDQTIVTSLRARVNAT